MFGHPQPDIPRPFPTSGTIGHVAYLIGPRGAQQVCEEVQAAVGAMQVENFDRDRWLEAWVIPGGPKVMLTMDHMSNRVVPVFALFKYRGMGASPLNDRLMAFVGTGDDGPRMHIRVAPADTEAKIGRARDTFAYERPAIEEHFGRHNANPYQLLPHAGADTEHANECSIPYVFPIPNALVYLAADCPHIYDFMRRVCSLGDLFPQHTQRLKSLGDWTGAACQRAENETRSELAVQWSPLTVMDAHLQQTIEFQWYSTAGMPPPPSPTRPQTEQPVGITSAEVEARMEALLAEKRAEAAKKTKLSALVIGWLRSLAGSAATGPTLPELTDGNSNDPERQGVEHFMERIQHTAGNEQAFRLMFEEASTRAAKKLGYAPRPRVLQPHFLRNLRRLELGRGLGTQYSRSHDGLAITASWYQFALAMASAATMAEENNKIRMAEERLNEATHVTPDDVRVLEGKPSTSPSSVTELIWACELYAIDLETVIGSNSDHQAYVIAIRDALDSSIGHWDMGQQQLDDIFWDIFLDGRKLFSTELGSKPPKSDLSMTLKFLKSRKFVPTHGVPYAMLSPKSKKSKSPKQKKPAVESDDELEATTPRKRKAKEYGKLDRPNAVLTTAWRNAVEACQEKLGDKPLVNTIVCKAKHHSSGYWSVKRIGDEILKDNRCTVGSITGRCMRPGCNFDHDRSVSGAEADQIGGILSDAMAAVANS